MTITAEINKAIVNRYRSAGRGVINIYLGRNQMNELLRWAKESGCLVELDTEGKNARHTTAARYSK